MTRHTLAALAAAAPATLASASIGNGGFEANPAFSGWTVTGAAMLSTLPPAAPTDGSRCALLTAGPTSPAQLALTAGCGLDRLQQAAGTPYAIGNGAAIVQAFNVSYGETLSFDYAFNNAELDNEQQWADCAILVVNGQPQMLASAALLQHGWTPVEHFTKSAPASGPLTIAFIVCNVNDTAVSSQLMIDNVRLSAPASAACGPADLAGPGAAPGPDARLDNNDFIAFIDCFFARTPSADLGSAGGASTPDGQFDANDFVAFIDAFFTARSTAGC